MSSEDIVGRRLLEADPADEAGRVCRGYSVQDVRDYMYSTVGSELTRHLGSAAFVGAVSHCWAYLGAFTLWLFHEPHGQEDHGSYSRTSTAV